MKTMKTLRAMLTAIVATAALALTACAGPTATVVIEHQTPATAPSDSATPPNTVMSGTQTCSFNAPDGSQFANVTVDDTANCSQWITALSQDGEFWTITQSPAPAYLDVCALQGDTSDMTMFIADEPSNDPDQYTNGVASGLCQSEETAGWQPTGKFATPGMN